MIDFDSVTYSYPGARQPAIRELSLHIGKGDRVCVLGANGSGKSTFARLVSGLARASEGKVLVDGKPPGKAETGFLFQNVDNQIVAATVAKDVAFGLENWGIERTEMVSLVEGVLNQFGIDSLGPRLTMELSGGEKQRVALAAVMVLAPGILILDEPDSFLDLEGRRLLRQELKAVKERFPELTEIRITQYPDLARDYERVMIFDKGSVVADGAVEDVLLDENLLTRTALKTVDIGVSEPDGLGFVAAMSGRDSSHAIVFDRVSFSYDGAPIIKELSFRLKRGETIGLVGASGTGKSTVLHLMCGLLSPDSGQIRAANLHGDDRDARQLSNAVTASLQQPERQFFLPTCAEEISFGPSNNGRTLSQAEIARLLESVGLSRAMMTRDPYTLSGGEQRRLAFATVLSLRPLFVAFDEPVCGLDRHGVARFLALSRMLKESGVGQLIISHDGEIIEQLTDRLIVLQRGGGYNEWATDDFFRDGQAAEIVILPHDFRST